MAVARTAAEAAHFSGKGSGHSSGVIIHVLLYIYTFIYMYIFYILSAQHQVERAMRSLCVIFYSAVLPVAILRITSYL